MGTAASSEWDEVKRLFHAALEQPPALRDRFLESECHGNEAVRLKVDRLLRGHYDAGSFLTRPAIDVLASDPFSANVDHSDRSMSWRSSPGLLPGSHVGRYEIVALLGVGGMGEVFRAHDPAIGRDVAIKLLPARFAGDADRVQRFEREARAAGALNHPNVLALHDVGYLDQATMPARAGTPFLVTELLEGMTLRARIDAGAVLFEDVLRWGAQIARGLAAAHAKGIVHRDLKPENLFLTQDGWIKILDFGLAKLKQPDEESATHLGGVFTEPGIILGSVGYMAPEQVRGQAADHRSDIFALGAILHELITGERAFRGGTPVETLNAILNAEPSTLARPGLVLSGLDTLVHRCLAKDPEARWQTSSDIAAALEAMSTPPVDRERRPWTNRASLAAGGVVLSAAALAAWWAIGNSPLRGGVNDLDRQAVVAVLPFRNIAAAAGTEYFAAGLTEEIHDQLSKISALRVLSRSAVDRYAGADPLRIAQELGAGSLVEGSARLDRERVKVSVRLTAPRTGDTLWSDEYERPVQDVFAVQSDIALRVARALKVTLSTDERARIQKPPTRNAEAYGLYLRALALDRIKLETNKQAIGLLAQASRLDPTFLLADVERATRLVFTPLLGQQSLDEGLALAERTVARDSSFGGAHAALAIGLAQRGKLRRAEAELREATKLDPNDTDALNTLSVVQSELGRYTEALRWARRSMQVDPVNPRAYYHVGDILLHLGPDALTERFLLKALAKFPRFTRLQWLSALLDVRRGRDDAAEARIRQVLALHPTDPEVQIVAAEIAFAMRKPDAEELLQFGSNTSERVSGAMFPESARVRLAATLARRGEDGRAKILLKEAREIAQRDLDRGAETPLVAMEMAAISVLDGNDAGALTWLQRGYDMGWRDARTLARDPIFAPVAGDQRFIDLLHRIEQQLEDMRRTSSELRGLDLELSGSP